MPPCPPGGISISAARRAKEIASWPVPNGTKAPVGLSRPRSRPKGGMRGPPRPSPPAVRGGIWADVSPLVRMQEISPSRGPKGSLEPAGWPPLARKSFQPSAFRILSPFSALVVYSESGAQPSAIQTLLSRTWQRAPARPGCRAPREAWRFAELPTALPGGERRLGAVHETSGGPSRSHPAQPVALEGSRALPGQSLATFF